MKDYQQQFISFALASGVLRFGQFTLKSGRQSPYFFNAGLFSHGATLARLGNFYAQAVVTADLDFDMIFGPAYKGIPLAAATAMALAENHGIDVPFCFNRKEAKDHGEGGTVVGAPLAGKVLIVDDVITAGTAINESMPLIKQAGATPSAIVISLDRQERGKKKLSAAQEVSHRHGVDIANIVTLSLLIEYLEAVGDHKKDLEAMRTYQKQYGID